MVSMLISNEGPVSNVVFSVILSCKLTMFIDIWIFQGRSSDTHTHTPSRSAHANKHTGIFDLF